MSMVAIVYLTDMPSSNKTPSAGIVLSNVVLSVPIVRDLNTAEPFSGVLLINSTVPAVPPDTIENPLSLTLLLPFMASAQRSPYPTLMFAAY